MPPTPNLVALDPPPKCASSKPMSGGGSADAADARGSGRIIQPSFLMGFVGLRAHGPETQLMLMMLVLGGGSHSRKPRKYRVFCGST